MWLSKLLPPTLHRNGREGRDGLFVHLGGLLVIKPGAAALAFGGVVVVTMLAAHAFDPRLIWDELGGADG